MLVLLSESLDLGTLLNDLDFELSVPITCNCNLAVPLFLEILTELDVFIGQLHYLCSHGNVVSLEFLPVSLNHSDSTILLQLHFYLYISLKVE